MNAVIKFDLVSDASDPAEPSSTRAELNAVTVTSYGELVSSVYVCDGVESDVATSEEPSPLEVSKLYFYLSEYKNLNNLHFRQN